MDQRRGLQGLAGLLLGQLPVGQPAQFVVDQRRARSAACGSPRSMAERMRVTSFMAGAAGDGLPPALVRGRDPALGVPAARPERGGSLQINRRVCEG